MSEVQIVNETKHADGSYVALVRYYGIEYAVHFISSEVRVYATRTLRLEKWKANKGASDVKKFIADRIKNFGESFMKAHCDLYGV